MRRTLRDRFTDDLEGSTAYVTEGLVLLAAWAQLLLLVGLLLHFVLRPGGR
jgi:hypothetical protein